MRNSLHGNDCNNLAVELVCNNNWHFSQELLFVGSCARQSVRYFVPLFYISEEAEAQRH